MKLFDSIKVRRPRLNKFDLSHERKMSMNMGWLTPIMCEEVIPGDKFRVKSEVFMRLAPMLSPVMHRCDAYVHYFYVPTRIIWEDFQEFITGGKDGLAAPVWPNITINQEGVTDGYWKNGGLSDYMGLPTFPQSATVTSSLSVSALPFRAYFKIWYEFFRDQNLDTTTDISLASGNIAFADPEYGKLLSMRKRCWEKDYFTSALPFAQRGAPVTMPISGTASVTYKSTSDVKTAAGVPATGDVQAASGDLTDGVNDLRIENIDEVSMDNATTTINDLRTAVRLQEWLEKNARGGARYIEQLLSHWGVVGDDARLQRPEYLGGGKSPVVISEVVSTFQDDVSEPQGNMAGHGISVGNSNMFRKRFKEHGFVIGLLSVLPRTAYQQGVHRKWRRTTKLEYPWPEFANLGEQAIQNWELLYDTQDPDYGGTWGYQSRYAEMKYGCSSVHGDMRGNLDYWHMGRIFDYDPGDGAPPLDQFFMESDPTHRIFPVTDENVHKLYVQVFNKVDALRPLPYYGTPML